MTKTKKRATGDLGEGIVCQHLENKGFTIIERNYWRPWGELDIVAKKEDKVHFVEVKTVTREAGQGSDKYRPEENMHPRKVQRLHRAIQTYLLQRKISENVAWQLDLACVYMNLEQRKAKVEIIENVIL